MISVAITTYNRSRQVVAALELPAACGWVDQIVVCDDASPDEDELCKSIESAQRQTGKPIELRTHKFRLGPLGNKLRALGYCHSDFAVLLDSDNALTKNYLANMLTVLDADHRDPWCVYCPAEAIGAVDYGKFAGETITKQNIGKFLRDKTFQMLLNTGNYVVPVKNFSTVVGFYSDQNSYAADAIFANYHWLHQGGKLKIVPNTQYHHAVHSGSIWIEWQVESLKVSDEILRKMEAWQS